MSLQENAAFLKGTQTLCERTQFFLFPPRQIFFHHHVPLGAPYKTEMVVSIHFCYVEKCSLDILLNISFVKSIYILIYTIYIYK